MSDASEAETTPAGERLLADLTRMFGRDAPPDGLVERAAGLVDWIHVDHEPAEPLDEPHLEAAGTRGLRATDTLATFEVGDASVVIELVLEERRLVGQVLAGAPSTISLERLNHAIVDAAIDDVGRFVFAEVATGPARLRWSTSSERPVITDWFVV